MEKPSKIRLILEHRFRMSHIKHELDEYKLDDWDKHQIDKTEQEVKAYYKELYSVEAV